MDAGLAVDTAVLTGALLLLLGAVLSGAAERFRTPGLLVVLALGMVIGDDGLALIRFDSPNLAQSIGVIALILILFEGGLSSNVEESRAVLAPAVAMATFGVAFPLTAGYPDGEIVFDVVFFVVLASATVQGLTIGPVGSLLGLDRTEATGTAAR